MNRWLALCVFSTGCASAFDPGTAVIAPGDGVGYAVRLGQVGRVAVPHGTVRISWLNPSTEAGAAVVDHRRDRLVWLENEDGPIALLPGKESTFSSAPGDRGLTLVVGRRVELDELVRRYLGGEELPSRATTLTIAWTP